MSQYNLGKVSWLVGIQCLGNDKPIRLGVLIVDCESFVMMRLFSGEYFERGYENVVFE